jgi:hemerythrin-like domain-containing protein
VVFPFLRQRVPKLEPLIDFFVREHADFREMLRSFAINLQLLLDGDDEKERQAVLSRVIDEGAYLFYLHREHVHAECKAIFETANRLLKNEEKQELDRLSVRKLHS